MALTTRIPLYTSKGIFVYSIDTDQLETLRLLAEQWDLNYYQLLKIGLLSLSEIHVQEIEDD